MTHVLFDFFGTLVDYSPSRVAQGYPRSFGLLRDLGATVTYDGFIAETDASFAALDRVSEADDREYSMAAAASALLAATLGRSASAAEITTFEQIYLSEWSAGVTPLDGLPQWLNDLRTRHRLAIVSNTHSPSMVPDFLSALGVAGLFDSVTLSVDVGWRKPHPAPFRAALSSLGIGAADAVFVGDSHVADYLGPSAVGIDAFLVDPSRRYAVPPDRRLDSVFDLTARLASRANSRAT